MSSSSLNHRWSGDVWQTFDDCENFRQRIILSTLTGKRVKMMHIREFDEKPGLRDYEASFLRLMDKLSNGCGIKINETGTTLWYRPGVLTGGDLEDHACPVSRAISYYLEGVLCLAPFCKQNVSITMIGVTNNDIDVSIDTVRWVTVPLLEHFGIDNSVEVKINKRGAPPLGGGEVYFRCGIVKQLKPIVLLNAGKVKKVRGIAYCTKTTPQVANRLVDKARGILNNFIPDVFITTDTYKGATSGLSPGFGLSLQAHSTTELMVSSDGAGAKGVTAEDVADVVTKCLCEDIALGGCVDRHHQAIMLFFMAFGPEDVSKIRLGELSHVAISMLRLLQRFVGVTFKIRSSAEEASRLKRRKRKLKEQEDEMNKQKKRKEAAAERRRRRKKKRRVGDEEESVVHNERDNNDDDDSGIVSSSDEESDVDEVPTVILSCLGVGFKNFARVAI